MKIYVRENYVCLKEIQIEHTFFKHLVNAGLQCKNNNTYYLVVSLCYGCPFPPHKTINYDLKRWIYERLSHNSEIRRRKRVFLAGESFTRWLIQVNHCLLPKTSIIILCIIGIENLPEVIKSSFMNASFESLNSRSKKSVHSVVPTNEMLVRIPYADAIGSCSSQSLNAGKAKQSSGSNGRDSLCIVL